MMAQSDPSSHFLGFLRTSPYTPLATDSEDAQRTQVKLNIGQILRSKRVRVVGVATLVVCAITFLFYGPRRRPNFDFRCPSSSSASPSSGDVDWTRYAYTQYVTNTAYLCNSVMLFEILHRLGSKADRLMMYPATMHPDPASNGVDSRMLLKAQNEYGVKLMPIEVQHRSGVERKNLILRLQKPC
jgi:hypothetical protein